MRIKNNLFLLYLTNYCVTIIFLIPALIERIIPKEQISTPNRILIIELWGIGDLVMMSSILRPLRDAYPGSQITLLSKAAGRSLFAPTPYIDDFVSFDFPWTRFKNKYRLYTWDWKGFIKTMRILRERKFDLILDARGDIRNNLLSFAIRGKRRVGYNWTGGGIFLTDSIGAGSAHRNKHRVSAWIHILNHLGINTSKAGPHLSVSPDEESNADVFLSRRGIKKDDVLVGIHPGAQIKTRCWPLSKFAQLAEYIRDTFKAKIIVFIDPQGYGKDIPIQGDFIKTEVTLREMVSLIKKLDLLICNDSAAMHIATGVDTKIVALFGPGDSKTIGPYGTGHTILSSADITCRPCNDYCKYSKAICLEKITVDDAAAAINKIVKRNLRIKGTLYESV